MTMVELFELPNEEADVIDSRPDIREKLMDGYEEFTEIVGNSSYVNDATDDYDESVMRQLEKLGNLTR